MEIYAAKITLFSQLGTRKRIYFQSNNRLTFLLQKFWLLNFNVYLCKYLPKKQRNCKIVKLLNRKIVKYTYDETHFMER